MIAWIIIKSKKQEYIKFTLNEIHLIKLQLTMHVSIQSMKAHMNNTAATKSIAHYLTYKVQRIKLLLQVISAQVMYSAHPLKFKMHLLTYLITCIQPPFYLYFKLKALSQTQRFSLVRKLFAVARLLYLRTHQLRSFR
ncbi:Hypothetical_protein [Hexamita inflata]|uniref:Hypothetical_protein n=1 Tax=Hexamita inflata TaxID=28002 RepID=A0AA86RLP9_9EUKA|nr:Hypothetical protein HINF_LOCUS56395 [Hexamita inflata]